MKEIALYWTCRRCHREVFVEPLRVNEKRKHFDVRCPLCDSLVRFFIPSPWIVGSGLKMSDADPEEVH